MTPDERKVFESIRDNPLKVRRDSACLTEGEIISAYLGGTARVRDLTSERRKYIRQRVMSALGALVKRGLIARERDRHNQRWYRIRSLLETLAEAARES